MKKSILWLGKAWSVSLAATLATLPVIVANFYQAPTYGILVNIVVTPLIGGAAVILVFLGLLLSFLPLPGNFRAVVFRPSGHRCQCFSPGTGRGPARGRGPPARSHTLADRRLFSRADQPLWRLPGVSGAGPGSAWALPSCWAV